MENLEDYLDIYYKTFFPYSLIYHWLSHTECNPQEVQQNAKKEEFSDYFSRREFSMTLRNDIYVRYLSFENSTQLKEEINRVKPHKIDIGAVYSLKPKNNKRVPPNSFRAREKELVFDIDASDYNDVRTCCKEAQLCNRCWVFMATAILVLNAIMIEDFGFTSILWVFSGRRGVHGWISDDQACKLTSEVRSDIANYISVLRGGEKSAKNVSLKNPQYPPLVRAYNIINSNWELLLQSQGFLDRKETWKPMISTLANENCRRMLDERWSSEGDKIGGSLNRWSELVLEVRDSIKKNSGYKTEEQILMELEFQYAYPRIDTNVTTGINHLLKSPFCVHPKTGSVCIPINPQRVMEFSPERVINIKDLCCSSSSGANVSNISEIQAYEDFQLCKEDFEKFISSMHSNSTETNNLDQSMNTTVNMSITEYK